MVVYTHPVDTVEEAQEQLASGAYGIYSSQLTPAEVEGAGAEYYLMQADESGKGVKLTDTVLPQDAVRAVQIHGNLEGKALKYKLDGKNLEERMAELSDSPSTIHNLSVELWDMSGKSEESTRKPLYIMNYILTKDQGESRILDKKYAYRLKALKELPDFTEVLSQADPKEMLGSMIEILSQSFIAKAGSYYYYNNESAGSYWVGDELMSPQKSVSGNVIVPLAETLEQLGAEDITMDSARYVYMDMNHVRTIGQVYGNYVRKDIHNVKISVPLSLYRGKTMGGGEIISTVSGRNFIENQDLLIILPQNCKVSKETAAQLIELADQLYKN